MLDMSELLCNRSVLALVNGVPWDMHRPLEDDCELKFLHFKDEDPDHCNRVGRFLNDFNGYLTLNYRHSRRIGDHVQ